jgi:hypothetical protein
MFQRHPSRPVASRVPSRRAGIQPCVVAIVLLLIVFVGGASVATACPMCKAGLAGEHDRLIQAWGVSIVFLLSMPFALVTSFSTYMYVLVRRARRDEALQRGPVSGSESLSGSESVSGTESLSGTEPLSGTGPGSELE